MSIFSTAIPGKVRFIPKNPKYHGRYLWRLTDALDSTIALTNRGGTPVAKIAYDAWGLLRFPDKPGHGVPPCKEDDLDDYLDRFEGGRSFENNGFDPWHLGRHHGKILDPYLFAGRRLDTFSQLYNNRNRFYSPSVGRFLTKDPIGFRGGRNLWGYVKNNPTSLVDPNGLMPPRIPGFSSEEMRQLIVGNISIARTIDQFQFENLVKSTGPWDFKHWRGSSWQNFGNYHFGLIGAATHMFYLQTLQREAGIAQCTSRQGSLTAWGLPSDGPPYGDDPNDQYWIAQGFQDFIDGIWGEPDYIGAYGPGVDLAEYYSLGRAATTKCPKKDAPKPCEK